MRLPVFLAVFALATVTVYFEIFGLSAMAPEVSRSMIALGISLAFAKYVGLSFAYRNWATLSWWLRSSLVCLVLMTMSLTSVGVFGYLQAAFAPSMSKAETLVSKLADLGERKAAVEQEIREIDAETKRVPTTVIRGRIALLREYDLRRQPLAKELQELRDAEREVKSEVESTRAHAGPLSYVATTLGVSFNRIVLWLCLLLTACLDPLALVLSLCLVHLKNKEEPTTPAPQIPSDTPDPTVVHVDEHIEPNAFPHFPNATPVPPHSKLEVSGTVKGILSNPSSPKAPP